MERLIAKCCGRAQCGKKVNKSELPKILQLFLIVGYLVGYSHIFIDQSLVYIPKVAYILYTRKFFLYFQKKKKNNQNLYLNSPKPSSEIVECAYFTCIYM